MSDKTMKTFIEAIERLQTERKEIDEKIAALSLAYETLYGESPDVGDSDEEDVEDDAEDEEDTSRAPIRIDRQAIPKTLAFLESRKRSVTAQAVAREFRIKLGAARQRLKTLVENGTVVRVGVGHYQLASRVRPETTTATEEAA